MPETGDPIFTPFTILIDTAEQMPFSFTGFYEHTFNSKNGTRNKVQHDLVVRTKDEHIPIKGTRQSMDYSIEGLQDEFAIERKSLSDLVGTLTKGRERFVRKLEAIQDYKFSAVLVEESWNYFVNCNDFTLKTRKTVMRSIVAFQSRYKTQWHFAGSRREAERWALRISERYWLDKKLSLASE